MALGGPWKVEVMANFLYGPFPSQKNEMIDIMLCSFREITAPCVAKVLASSKRGGRSPDN